MDRVAVLQDKKVWGWRVVMVVHNVNVFNTTELYTLKW